MPNQTISFKNKLSDLDQSDFEHKEDFFKRSEQTFYTDDTPPSQRITSADEVWIDASNDGYEGQLAVDVYQDERNLYVKAIIGGARPDDIEIHLNNDLLTIKGKRLQPTENIAPDQYYIQECYWGGFSRSIILPIDVANDQVEATISNGTLSLKLPKTNRPKNTKIPIKEL